MPFFNGRPGTDSTTAATTTELYFGTPGSVYEVTTSTTADFITMMEFAAYFNNDPAPVVYIPEPIPTCIIKQAWQAERREAERSYLQQIAKAERHRPKKGKFRKVNRRKIRR